MARPGVYVTEAVTPTPVISQPSAAAAGALVAPLPSGPASPTLVTSWYQFTQIFGGMDASYIATFGANMFFRAGGRDLYVHRVVKSDAVKASVSLATSDANNWITFTAKAPGTYGNDLRILITKNARNLYDVQVVREAGVGGQTGDDTVLETFSDLDLATFGGQDVVDIFAIRSLYIDAAWVGASSAKSITTTLTPLVLTGGTDGSAGTYDYATALNNLALVDRTLVVFSPGNTDSSHVASIVTAATTNKWFAVLDTAAGLTPAQAITYAGTVGVKEFAGVYYPHLWIPDPTSASRDAIRKVPPSGAVAGTIIATDSSRGVFKSPAGIEAAITGVVAVERGLTAAELDSLNDSTSPVNPIRVIAGVGPAIMGARTLDTTDSTRYINIRRTLSYLDREMKSQLEFAIFRNNDNVLWGQMKTVLDSFLVGFWQAGGLRGGTKAQAYYIKIDSENNTPTDVANGIVNVEVGLALQYPAEFIKVTLTQQTLS